MELGYVTYVMSPFQRIIKEQRSPTQIKTKTELKRASLEEKRKGEGSGKVDFPIVIEE